MFDSKIPPEEYEDYDETEFITYSYIILFFIFILFCLGFLAAWYL